MSVGTTRPIDWPVLIERLHQQRCTPFLGAAVSSHLFPEGNRLANQWIEEYDLPIPKNSRLDYVAQMVSVQSDAMTPKDVLAQAIRQSKGYDPLVGKDIFTVLANLPVPIYITTNYDDYLEQALRSAGRRPQTVLCPWNHEIRHHRDCRPDPPTPEEPWVYHLHGHFREPESMVLTEDDYTDFLVNIWKGKQDILPHRIERAIAGTMLMLLGYSLRDITFRVLFRGLIAPREDTIRRNGLTVQLSNPPAPDNQGDGETESHRQRYLELYEQYFRNMNFRVYWGGLGEFLHLLHEKISR